MSTNVSSVVSHFPSAENGFTTTTSGSVSSGAATVGLNSVAGYSNGEVVVFVIDPANSSKQTFTGVVDTGGVQVTDVVWTAGTNTAHSAGATVVDYATATHISMITKGLLVEHTQAGLHVMSTPKITSGINDTNGNELIKFTATGSAVNEVTLANAATGNMPTFSATGGDTNITIKGTGKGTGGFITVNPYKFYVYRNSAQNTGNGAFAKINFDTEVYDTSSNFDSATNYRFTAPIAGVYHFDAATRFTSTRGILALYKNGSEYARGNDQTVASSEIGVQVSADITLAASDYVEVYVFGATAVAMSVGNTQSTRFNGHLVSA